VPHVVYRHVATKAELRDLVVGRWVEATMPPLRAIAALPGPAPQRLRRLFDALIAAKRRRAVDNPEPPGPTIQAPLHPRCQHLR